MGLLLAALLSAGVFAQAPSSDTEAMSAAARRAEYVRLSHEIDRFAERQAWNAVENTYQRCLELLPPALRQDPTQAGLLRADDFFHAAYAARDRGDILAARDRLRMANKLENGHPDVIDWMFAIDTGWSEVHIEAWPGAELVVLNRPFDPIQGKAIDFAIARMAETGRFDGMFPHGLRFAVQDRMYEVRRGRGPVVDTLEPPKGAKKKKKR